MQTAHTHLHTAFFFFFFFLTTKDCLLHQRPLQVPICGISAPISQANQRHTKSAHTKRRDANSNKRLPPMTTKCTRQVIAFVRSA